MGLKKKRDVLPWNLLTKMIIFWRNQIVQLCFTFGILAMGFFNVAARRVVAHTKTMAWIVHGHWSRFSLCLMGTKPPVYFKYHSWWSFGNMSHFYCGKHCCQCTAKYKSASQSTCETFFLLQTFYLLPASAGASNIALNFSLVSKRFAARMPKIDMECNIICTAMMVFADFFGHKLVNFPKRLHNFIIFHGTTLTSQCRKWFAFVVR